MKQFYTKIFLICIASSFASAAFCMQGGFLNNGGRGVFSEKSYQEQAAREAAREASRAAAIEAEAVQLGNKLVPFVVSAWDIAKKVVDNQPADVEEKAQ